MFNPTRDESRDVPLRPVGEAPRRAPLTPLEAMALAIVVEHPEYHAVLADRERYLEREWTPEGGETNPFLHLMMHVAIEEQLSIDHPPGIRAAVEALAAKRGSMHDARHDVMECLAEVIWQAQRNSMGFDNTMYLDCLARKILLIPEILT
jgi:hypothetical protein